MSFLVRIVKIERENFLHTKALKIRKKVKNVVVHYLYAKL